MTPLRPEQVRTSKRISRALRHRPVMSAAGMAFYRSANGVWLTDEVPPRYLVKLPL